MDGGIEEDGITFISITRSYYPQRRAKKTSKVVNRACPVSRYCLPLPPYTVIYLGSRRSQRLQSPPRPADILPPNPAPLTHPPENPALHPPQLNRRAHLSD